MSLLDVVVPGVGSAVQAVTKILTLCQQMKEGQDACTRVHARLQTVLGELQRLEARKQLPPSEAIVAYTDVLTRYLQYLERYRAKPLASRLIRHARMMDELRQFHEDVDTLFQLLQLAVAETVMGWREQWTLDQKAQQRVLGAMVDNDVVILHELRDLRTQMEAMTLLQFELKRRPTPSAPELDDEPNRDHDTELMRRMFKTVVRTSQGSTPSVPPWFLPPDDVAFDPIPFARGSFATVHRGTWGFGTRVVIKRLLVDDSRAGELLPPRFEKEVSLWHTLNHPNVVKMFGASHVSWPPFIVCEDAVGGNLSSYLTRSPSVKQRSMWRLLYEAALGLDYLHRSRVVHGDLKLNNLLVGADGQAKVADFGLSAVRNTLSTSSTAGAGSRGPQSGGLRWRAPECLRRAPTFASDVYSFAMCLIEAVTDEPPFAFLDDESVRENLRHGDIPDRPDDMSQDAWALVLAMTRFDPSERITMPTVLTKLQTFARREISAWEASSQVVVTCRRCGSQLLVGNEDHALVECIKCRERVDSPIQPTNSQPITTGRYSDEPTVATDGGQRSAEFSGREWVPIATADRVGIFMDHLKSVDDEQKQAHGIRELLLWLIDTVDDPPSTEFVANSGVVGLLFDLALRSDNYFAKVLVVGALDLLLDQGYHMSSALVQELKASISDAGAFDLSFIIRALQTGDPAAEDEKRHVLVLCSCLAVARSSNQDLLHRAGILPFLVDLIKQPTSALAAHAALALGSLTCGNIATAAQAAQAGVLTPLVALVGGGLPAARAWSAYAIGNLACTSACRRALESRNAAKALLALLMSGSGLQQQWAAYALATLVTGGGVERGLHHLNDAVPVLASMAQSGSSGQKIWAAYALGAMADCVRAQFKSVQLVAAALDVLLGSDIELQQLWAAYAVRKLAHDSPSTRSVLTSAGIVSRLAAIVARNEHSTRLETTRALTELATDSPPNCDAIIATNIMPVIVVMTTANSTGDEKLHVVSMVSRVVANANATNRAKVATPAAIATLVAIVQSPSAAETIQAEASCALGSLAQAGEPTRAAIEATNVVPALQLLEQRASSWSPLAKWTAYALKQLKPSRRGGRLLWSRSKQQSSGGLGGVGDDSPGSRRQLQQLQQHLSG